MVDFDEVLIPYNYQKIKVGNCLNTIILQCHVS